MRIDVISLFACAGGTSTGFELARVDGERIFKVIAAVDIDSLALASHKENWPECRNFVRDITTMDPKEIIQVRTPGAPLILWASPECTEYSGAESGPKDIESHQLSESMYPFIKKLKPEVILVENVPGFVKYGPLDEYGIPVPKLAGSLFRKWHETIEAFGYTFSWRKLNAADYGAYTKRERFFGAFVRTGMRFEWPHPTHSAKGGLFAEQWKGCGEKLDHTNPGESIFTRAIPLVDNSLDRIIKGVKKFVGPQVFTVNTNGTHTKLSDPVGTIVSSPTQAVMVPFMQNYNGNGKNHSSDRPCPTITSDDRLVSITAMVVNTAFKNDPIMGDKPAPTIVANQKSAPLNIAFMESRQRYWRGVGNDAASEGDTPKTGRLRGSIGAEAMAQRTTHTVQVTPLSSPHWEYQEGDTQTMRDLRDLCRKKGVYDIYFRMCTVQELKELQGFPADYIFCGNIKDQKSFIGKSVVPKMAEVLGIAAYNSIYESLR